MVAGLKVGMLEGLSAVEVGLVHVGWVRHVSSLGVCVEVRF